MDNFLKKFYSNDVMKSVTFLFVILGPVIDVFTGWTNRFPVSAGIIVKILFVGYILFYMLFVNKDRKIISYIIVTLVFIIINLSMIITNYGMSFAFANLVEIFKTFFFTYSLIWLYLLYKKIGFVIRWNDIQFVFMLIFLIFAISMITQTDYKSYSWSSASSGWFFSGNEISAILASLFSIGYIAIFKTKSFMVKIIVALIIVFFSMVVGTRSVFYAAIGLYFWIIFYSFVQFGLHRKLKYLINISIVIFAISITFLLFPSSPSSSNTSSNPVVVTPGNGSSDNNVDNDNDTGYGDEILDEIIDIGGAITGDKSSSIVVALNSILKNRVVFLAETHKIYNESNEINRFFGIGSFIYEDGSRKQIQIEMDFFTIFYRYGFLGFLLYLIPLLVLAYAIIIRIIKYPKVLLSFEFLSMCYSMLILLGLSFLAGHVLIAPSVSIYLAVFGIGVLNCADRLNLRNGSKEKVVFVSSAGGHLTQLMKLQPLFENYDSVLITEDISINHSINTNAIIRYLPYGSRAEKGYFYTFARMFIRSIIYFVIDRPQVIVTTGTHTAVPLALISKIFGRRLIYIESFAKRTSPNLAGRILYPFADLMVVQWEPMLKVYKKSKNWGWIY